MVSSQRIVAHGVLALALGAVLVSCRIKPQSAVLADAADGTAGADPAEAPSLGALLAKAKNPNSGVKFIPIPLVRQSRDFTCGTTSMQSMLYYYGDEFREGQLQKLLKTDPDGGTPYKEMVELLKQLNRASTRDALFDTRAPDESMAGLELAGGGNGPDGGLRQNTNRHGVVTKVLRARNPDQYTVKLHEGKSLTMRDPAEAGEAGVPTDGMSLKELLREVDNGHPILVVLQAWNSEEGFQYDNDYDDGHYVVVIGYDQDHIYIMDPSTQGQYAWVPRANFINRWHDVDVSVNPETGAQVEQRVIHFGLIFYKREASFAYDYVSKMD